jgi:hypothetical protein
MNLKNILLAYPFQIPLIFVSVFGAHSLTDLNIWWCTLIAYFFLVMYDFGEIIRRND